MTVGVTRVLEEDPELARHLDPGIAEALRPRLVTPVLDLPRGLLQPGSLPVDSRGLCVLLLHGLMMRRVTVSGRPTAELVATGDVLRPWDENSGTDSLAAWVTWKVLKPVRLAVLDEGFEALAARCPALLRELVERLERRARWLAVQLAIVRCQRVEARLLALFWLLADRFGRRGPDGTLIPLSLSHEELGDLVCATRPRVTGAIRQLAELGLLARRPDRTWLLQGEPPANFTPDVAGAQVFRFPAK